MKTSCRKLIISVLIITCLFAASSALISAYSSATGSYGYITNVFGYSYRMRNKVGVGSGAGNIASSFVYIETLSGTAPTGYMGAQARVFAEDGGLKEWSNWSYNNSSAYSQSASSILYTLEVGNSYCSDGITRAWNGTGYWTYGGVPSPFITYYGD